MRMEMSKTIFATLVLGTVAMVAFLWLPGASAQNPPATSPPVNTLPGDVRDLAAAVEKAAQDSAALSSRYSGEFVSAQRSELTPRIGGRVKTVMVDEGALVQSGAVLLELETEYLDLDVTQAAAEVARAQAALTEAERDARRKAALVAKGSVSEAASFRSSSVFEQAKAQLDAAVARLSLARRRRGDAVLRAPFRGVVEQRLTNAGERLTEAKPAFVIVQLAPLKLRFRVRETDLTLVRKGQGVEADVDAYPGVKFRGVISVAGGAVDPSTRTFLAEARFENGDLRLRPGLFARVRVLTSP